MVRCPCCDLVAADAHELAGHFLALAAASDVDHVMWLNRAVTPKRVGEAELAKLLAAVLEPAGRDAGATR